MSKKIMLFILAIALGFFLNAQDTQTDKQEKDKEKKKTEQTQTSQTNPVTPPPAEKTKPEEINKTQPVTNTEKEKPAKPEVPAETQKKDTQMTENKPSADPVAEEKKEAVQKETTATAEKNTEKKSGERQHRRNQVNALIKSSLEKTGFSIYEFKYSRFKNDNAFFFGGGGGLIYNNTFSLGGKVYFLINQYYPPANIQFPAESMEMVYGGIYLEKIFFWPNLIHFSVGSLFGAGLLALNDRSKIISLNENEYDLFFVIEPDITLIMNLTRNLRLRLAAGYRFVSGIERIWTNNDILTNTSISLGIQIEE